MNVPIAAPPEVAVVVATLVVVKASSDGRRSDGRRTPLSAWLIVRQVLEHLLQGFRVK